MFWTVEKISARVEELESYRYRNAFFIPSFQFQEDEEAAIAGKPPESGSWSEKKIGDYWQGRDEYAWLSVKVTIPQEWNQHTVIGLFDFGKVNFSHTSGFESLLYINGEPYQGVDTNHNEVFFKEEHIGKEITMDFRLWSGLEGLSGRGKPPFELEHKIQKAEIAVLDSIADDLYYTSKAAVETLQVLDKNQLEYHSLLKVVNKAFYEIDWSTPGSQGFYDSLEKAQQVLSDGIKEIGNDHPIVIRTIGHTHIDVAWLWRLKHTREKAARSFSTVLRLMEKFPEYIFLQTQPQLYEYIKHDFPEIYEQIKEKVKEGKWEAEGGMWLEPDCNIPSGESFVRQLLLGKRFLKQEFDVESTYLWLPDVFGYSWALPQILKKSGIKTFMTTKISWNQYNRMPHDTFMWRGIDGTEILTHFITTPIPGSSGWQYTYNGEVTPETVKGIWDVYHDKELTNELLIAYGYGDGGGGVNRDMLEMRRRLDDMPGLPKVKTSTAGEYFDHLHKQVEETDSYVHTWDGELYLELHRGTYTSQAYNKKINRKMELLYRETELLGVVGSLNNKSWESYPSEELYNAWKILLRNQFHDIIPGSSIEEVYQDSRKEFADAEAFIEEGRQKLSDSLIEQEAAKYTLINDASWRRKSLVEIPVTSGLESGKWLTNDGETLPAEQVNGTWIIQTDELPSLGTSTIVFDSSEQVSSDSRFEYEDNVLTTPFYEIKWNEKGHLTSIYDLQADREVLKQGSTGNVLQVFEDKPMFWDAWDIDIFYQEKMKEIEQLQSVKVIEQNSLRAVIRFEWQYGESTIEQDLTVYANTQRIDFKTKVNWKEQEQLLKVAFPVEVRSTEATFDIQYGNVKRPTHWNTSWDFAKFETAAHQWADLSEQGYGVSLLNDSKYGYDVKGHVLRLTLLKSATFPDKNQDQGEHEFTYSLYPHQGDWVEANTVQEAWDLNQPISYIEGKIADDEFSAFKLSKDNIVIDAVKKAEDENKVVLRLHEYTGARGKAVLSSDWNIKSWQECDLMEQPVGEKVEKENLEFSISPYEIKTFLIEVE